jgi:hypothetical protein
MGVSFLLAVLLAQSTPAPSASPSSPPVIIRVQSKNSVCQSLEESIGPSIAGLIQNDGTIVDGMCQLRAMSADARTLRFHMDMLHLENDVSKIVRNLDAIDHLLVPATPPDATPDELLKIETMKKSLRDVARQQLMTLNTLDGILESRQLSQFLDSSALPNFSIVDQEGSAESKHDATHRDLEVPAKARPDPQAAGAGSFFPQLQLTETAASHAVVQGAAGCEPFHGSLRLKPN